MEDQRLSFEVMLSYRCRALEGVEDPRQPSHAQRYSLRDLVLGAFSVFYLQCPSFLEHQRQMPAIVNSKTLEAETLDASFRSSSIEGIDRLKRPKLLLNLFLLCAVARRRNGLGCPATMEC